MAVTPELFARYPRVDLRRSSGIAALPRRLLTLVVVFSILSIATNAAAHHRPTHGAIEQPPESPPIVLVAPFESAMASTNCSPTMPGPCQASASAARDGSLSVLSQSGPLCRPTVQLRPNIIPTIHCYDQEWASARIGQNFSSAAPLDSSTRIRLTVNHGATRMEAIDGTASLRLGIRVFEAAQPYASFSVIPYNATTWIGEKTYEFTLAKAGTTNSYRAEVGLFADTYTQWPGPRVAHVESSATVLKIEMIP